jgi:hypothetical protein
MVAARTASPALWHFAPEDHPGIIAAAAGELIRQANLSG